MTADEQRQAVDEFQQYEKTYDNAYRDAITKFQDKVQEHLDELVWQNADDQDYMAIALPFNGATQALIISGDDLKTFALRQIAKAGQYFKGTLDAMATGQRHNFPDNDELDKLPEPRAFNWAKAVGSDWMNLYRDQKARAEHQVLIEFWQKAQKTLDIVV